MSLVNSLSHVKDSLDVLMNLISVSGSLLLHVGSDVFNLQHCLIILLLLLVQDSLSHANLTLNIT